MGQRMKSERSSLSTPRAFTLLELLIVIAIIAALVSVLLPALRKSRLVAERAVCGGRLRQAGIGFNIYLNDFKQYAPKFIENLYWAAPGYDSMSQTQAREYMDGLMPEKLRHCPSYTFRSITSDGGYGFVWSYTVPLLASGYGGNGLMQDRKSADNLFVRLVPGRATDNPGNNYGEYDPLASFPLIADRNMYYSGGDTISVYSHRSDGGNVHQTPAGLPYNGVSGGNTLWLDGHVEWHNWEGPNQSAGMAMVRGYSNTSAPFYAQYGDAAFSGKDGWAYNSLYSQIDYVFWMKGNYR